MLNKINHFLATGFYSGHLPAAPGTWGSLLMVLLIFFFPLLNNIYLLSALTIGGVAVANFEERQTGIKDDGRIVIDEMAGQLLTFYTLPTTLPVLVGGFILFRLFDITKPWLIDKVQNLPSGWGVMMDDILAGLTSLIILKILITLI
ncbi:phosphatidylglycerophosphatase A [Halanaerobium saccharolyticum]|uniref:Phosphatidylglycerophosphatase A n=1 Tax=Halanaerobium saccharolyticum TaxID=43595 RepID=A0A4R7Z6I1_9FIRM|nr:phosphatidylglycerophosphatase A [Halanaerobium saccharolyticum]RAK11176.1 phosphatidylglycerophosphatase A [Halanaerobium saccharolyticum]TDW07027.1 phosphatidylglycerophosphatase A [Halanaerobium saccharolyticum]TDX63792.1 phosphatidylglycerophosphatase A [Halanaerobium saccharolyticum]